MNLYDVVGALSFDEFSRLVDKSNSICQILLAHWLAVHHILRPITFLENPGRDISPMFHMIESWCNRIHAALPRTVRSLIEWPMNFSHQASPWRNITFDNRPASG